MNRHNASDQVYRLPYTSIVMLIPLGAASAIKRGYRLMSRLDSGLSRESKVTRNITASVRMHSAPKTQVGDLRSYILKTCLGSHQSCDASFEVKPKWMHSQLEGRAIPMDTDVPEYSLAKLK